MLVFLYKLITMDIGGITILGESFSFGLDLLKNKVISTGEEKKIKFLLSEFYEALQVSFKYFNDSSKVVEESVNLASDKLWIEWSKHRVLSDEIVKKSLKIVLGHTPDDNQVALWYEKFIELLISNQDLCECFKLNALMEIEKQNKDMKNTLEEILEIIKKDEKVNVVEYPKYISNPPFPITDAFVGREILVREVSAKLKGGSSCYLYGMGGIGKTEIAKGVVKQIRSELSNSHGIYKIAWINYQEGDFKYSLIQNILEIKSIVDKDEAWNKVVDLIENLGERLLIVIDNIENYDDEILMSAIGHFKCRILATSRVDKLGVLEKINVSELDAENSRILFYHYYKIERNNKYLNEILNLIDYHTIMIELLAKVAEIEEIILEDLLEKLIEAGFRLSNEKVDATHEFMRREDIIIEQLKRLFSVLKCKDDEKKLLLKISVIPALEFDYEQAKKWFLLSNKTILNRLYYLGWIKKGKKDTSKIFYVMHSIIAAAIRSQFEEEIYDACQPFIRELTKEMSFSMKEIGAQKKWLIQFSWSVNDILHNKLYKEEDAVFLLNLAHIYKEITNYNSALSLYRQILNIYCKIEEVNTRQIGEVLLDIAVIKECLGEYSCALNYYASILLSIWKVKIKDLKMRKLLGRTYSNIADIYRQINKYDYAQRYFERAIETQNTLEEEDVLYLAMTYNNRAVMYNEMGKYNSALKDYEYVLNIRKNILGEEHPDVGTTLNNIAVLQYDTGHYGEALEKYLATYNIYKNCFGEKHVWVATVQHNIGTLYEHINEYEKALSYLTGALNVEIELLGEEHLLVAATYNSIGTVYLDKEKYNNALEYYFLALKIRTKKLDMEHYLIGLSYYSIGKVYQKMNNKDKAYNYYKKAYDIFIEKLGGDHQYTKNAKKGIDESILGKRK